MNMFYGGESSLRVIEKDGHILLRSKLLRNVIIFLVVLVVLLILLGIVEALSQPGRLFHIIVYSLLGYLGLSMLVMLTYTKVFDFDSQSRRLTMYRTILGIGKKRVVDFDSIRSISIEKVSFPIAGSQYPFSADMIECHLHLKNGDTVYVDRGLDTSAMLVLAHPVSRLASLPIEERN